MVWIGPTGSPSAEAALAAERRVRVAVDLTAFADPPDDAGLFALDLLRVLPPLVPGWEFLLLAPPESDRLLRGHEAANVHLCLVSGGRRAPVRSLLGRFRPARVLRRLASMLRPASVLAGTTHPLLATLGAHLLLCPLPRPSCCLAGVPTVAVLSDLTHLDYPEFYSSSERGEKDRAFRELVDSDAHLVCLTEHLRQTVLHHATPDPRRLWTIRVGVPGPLARPAPSTVSRMLNRHGLTPGRFFLYRGAPAPQGNLAMLLTAFGMHRSRRPTTDLRLVLEGATDLGRGDLERAVDRLGLGPHVVIAQETDDEDWAALAHTCAALICPVLHEEFGRTLVEALALGRPILCSNLSGLPEVVGDAAILFDPRKPGDLVQVLGQVEDQDPETWRQRAIRQAERLGGVDRMARDYLHLLRQALGERGSQGAVERGHTPEAGA